MRNDAGGGVPLREFPKRIDASCYNVVRLALNRVARPLRIELPGHRGLEAVLDDFCWLVVDGLHDDLPILAWTGFENRRSGLHEAVPCRLKLYHLQAGLVMGTALDSLEQAVKQLLMSGSNASGEV
jgi:hypothetical protein